MHDERLQARLATRAPAQVELCQLIATLAIAGRRERAEDPFARIGGTDLAVIRRVGVQEPPTSCALTMHTQLMSDGPFAEA
jgi:hypothetical protein